MRNLILATFALAIAAISAIPASAEPDLNSARGRAEFWKMQTDHGNGG